MNHTKMIGQTTRTLFVMVASGAFPLASAQAPRDASSVASVEEKSLDLEYQAAKDLLKGSEGEEFKKKGFQMMIALAEKGYLPAIAGVGYLYDVGMGTPKDKAEAAKWFRLAAEKDHAISKYNLGKLLATDEIPLPEGVVGRKAQHEEGVEWIRKAADQGLRDAQAAYGVILLRGDYGTKMDVAAAVGYLKPAAEAGNLEAMNALGLMHSTGNGVAHDLSASERLFRRAAMGGNIKAQANLGDHLNPLSQKPEQQIEALAWLFIAEEAKDIVAKKLLELHLRSMSQESVAAAREKAAELKLSIKDDSKTN